MSRILTAYESFLERKQREYGEKFDASDLDLRFASFLHSETRIKVEAYGQIQTGTVGVTSGWKPAFLLMHNSRCIGSSTLLGRDYKIVAVKRGTKYQAVR